MKIIKLKITQIRSVIGNTWRKKQTMKTLGLRKINHSVVHTDTSSIRGMIKKVKELVAVDEVK